MIASCQGIFARVAISSLVFGKRANDNAELMGGNYSSNGTDMLLC